MTSSSHSARGRVHHGALKGNFMRPPPPGAGRTWDAEASGRLRSLSGTKEEARDHAIEYCKKHNGSFNGYMVPNHGQQIIGLVVEGLTLDIRYTPIQNADQAHADLCFSGQIPTPNSDEHKKLLLALADYFTAIHETQWWMLPDSTIGQPPPSGPTAPASPPIAQPGENAFVRAFRAFLNRT
ncbi:hypothetical protein [Bradyrhizobium sp. SZCCHNR3091]|uniref:hypothetical protein n=1 Tax=Bradyrhizobium sp. SZCCHNR3091 TaxID=3057443 RepID=UPI00291685B5|nr:hypothetical protein [Bradyrhizobium sp. SZCCHNR3091]